MVAIFLSSVRMMIVMTGMHVFPRCRRSSVDRYDDATADRRSSSSALLQEVLDTVWWPARIGRVYPRGANRTEAALTASLLQASIGWAVVVVVVAATWLLVRGQLSVDHRVRVLNVDHYLRGMYMYCDPASLHYQMCYYCSC